ncbi:MAG TPA: hypothetical protein VJR70_00660 [Stellaceae bacterium]|nr:hypothetical protein [Stellaceae bacterium]
MPNPARLIAVIAAVMALAGCAGPPGPPWAEAVSPNGITLRWYPDETSGTEAQLAADAHCAPSGRHAGIAAIEQNGSVRIADYRCR